MTEPTEVKRKRLYMRSIRRGIKEMDLILMAFADKHLATLDEAELTLYDALLSENDHDLYQWVTGQGTAPENYAPLMDRIIVSAQGVVQA